MVYISLKRIDLAPEVYSKAIIKHPYLNVDYIIGTVQEAIESEDYEINEKGQFEIARRRKTNGKWVIVIFYAEEREDHYYVRVHVKS